MLEYELELAEEYSNVAFDILRDTISLDELASLDVDEPMNDEEFYYSLLD